MVDQQMLVCHFNLLNSMIIIIKPPFTSYAAKDRFQMILTKFVGQDKCEMTSLTK